LGQAYGEGATGGNAPPVAHMSKLPVPYVKTVQTIDAGLMPPACGAIVMNTSCAPLFASATELASIVTNESKALDIIRETLSADKVSALPSDDRFRRVLRAVKRPSLAERDALDLKSPRGQVVGKASFSSADVKLTVEKSRAEAFSAFLKEELPLLMEKFFGQQDRE